MNLIDIKPSVKHRVMDLVEQAGISVSNWRFKANGDPIDVAPAANPNYCYEWSFRNDKEKIAVLNLWFEYLDEAKNGIQTTFNIRKLGEETSETGRRRRAQNMDSLIRIASLYDWSIRVIIMDGRQLSNGKEKANKRILDPLPWHIEKYDANSGECILARGIGGSKYVDQFDLREELDNTKSVTNTVYERSAKVRQLVLKRAAGHCEYCGQEGFITLSGSCYLETHHIEPLALGGPDHAQNVIALCPHHHKYAHYSQNQLDFKNELLALINDMT
jgi:5-methylcytosine-specific restriction protein A